MLSAFATSDGGLFQTAGVSDVASCIFLQIFGGAGYNQEYPVEKLMRDAKIFMVCVCLPRLGRGRGGLRGDGGC